MTTTNNSMKKTLKDLLDGSLLTKQMVLKQLPFIIFLTILTFIYIGNNYKSEKVGRDIVKLQHEINELRQESISLAADLMYYKRHSEVAKLIQQKEYGLYESQTPPKVIVVKGR